MADLATRWLGCTVSLALATVTAHAEIQPNLEVAIGLTDGIEDQQWRDETDADLAMRMSSEIVHSLAMRVELATSKLDDGTIEGVRRTRLMVSVGKEWARADQIACFRLGAGVEMWKNPTTGSEGPPDGRYSFGPVIIPSASLLIPVGPAAFGLELGFPLSFQPYGRRDSEGDYGAYAALDAQAMFVMRLTADPL